MNRGFDTLMRFAVPMFLGLAFALPLIGPLCAQGGCESTCMHDGAMPIECVQDMADGSCDHMLDEGEPQSFERDVVAVKQMNAFAVVSAAPHGFTPAPASVAFTYRDVADKPPIDPLGVRLLV